MLKPITVIITDDKPIWRKIITETLADQGIKVIAEATNGNELLTHLQTLKPDVVLLDLNMEDMDGNATMDALNLLYPKQNVLIISGHNETWLKEDFISRGAMGFLSKDEVGDADELIRAIRRISSGKRYINFQKEKPLFRKPSRRQVDIIHKIAEDKKVSEISLELNISEDSVRKQIRKIKTMLGKTYLKRIFDGGLRFLRGSKSGFISKDDGSCDD